MATLAVAGLASAAIFSFAVFAPSLTMARERTVLTNGMRTTAETMYKDLNRTNYALRAAFKDAPFDAFLNATVVSKLAVFKQMFNKKVSSLWGGF